MRNHIILGDDGCYYSFMENSGYLRKDAGSITSGEKISLNVKMTDVMDIGKFMNRISVK